MSWRTNNIVVGLRRVSRLVGINRLLASVLSSGGYEDRFQAAMLAAVRSGDIVWDIGANAGLYTKQFSAIAGAAGRVFAFEPSPENLQRLRTTVAGLANVTILPVALGEREMAARYRKGTDELGATGRVVEAVGLLAEGEIEVDIISGDALVNSGKVEVPNVVKIDTEGFEFEVLRGMMKTLIHKGMRTLCVEIHFGLLAKRGLPNAPGEIEKLLESAGFRVEWADSSHIVATREA